MRRRMITGLPSARRRIRFGRCCGRLEAWEQKGSSWRATSTFMSSLLQSRFYAMWPSPLFPFCMVFMLLLQQPAAANASIHHHHQLNNQQQPPPPSSTPTAAARVGDADGGGFRGLYGLSCCGSQKADLISYGEKLMWIDIMKNILMLL